MANSQPTFGINRWVSELGLSGDEARVFDVLYRKSHKTAFNIYSRRFFWLHFHQEFAGVSYRCFNKYVLKFQSLYILVLEKREDGIYMRTYAEPIAQQTELALEVECVAERSQNKNVRSQKRNERSQNENVCSSPHTPLYKKEKDKKKTPSIPQGGGGSREMAAQQPATAATTTDFFLISKDEQWQLAWEYGQKKGIARDVVSDWFLNRSSVGWIKGRGQKIVGWEADLVAWNRRQAPLAKADNPAAQPIHYTPDPDFQHLVDQICHRYTGK